MRSLRPAQRRAHSKLPASLLVRFRVISLHLQLKPFQWEADRIGACLDIVDRSIQFGRDQFRAGVCFRHFSKEVILSRRPPGASYSDHVILFRLPISGTNHAIAVG